jgi:endonuclease G
MLRQQKLSSRKAPTLIITVGILITSGFLLISAQRNKVQQKNAPSSSVQSSNVQSNNPSTKSSWAMPAILPTETVTQHSAYSLVYNHKHMQAKWVAYNLTYGNTVGGAERSSKFSIDPSITPRTAVTSDYTKTGYDRGHLAPAGDMKFSAQAMSESFYMSNVSPQLPGFNRGIWKKLEEQFRSWAPSSHPVFVVTGPVLTDPISSHIGQTCRISVPQRFYKVMLDTASPMRAIAFVMSNNSSTQPLSSFAMSIDEAERITGIDFFPKLNDIQEAKIEKTLILNQWRFN